MRALIQRVTSASVAVDGVTIGSIGAGVLAYIGIAKDDDDVKAHRLVDKILTYRIFENTTDTNKLGKLDKSVVDTKGGLLLISQFTLMAHTDKGRRPDFAPAMSPADAKRLFDGLTAYAHSQYPHVQTGRFGAAMVVTSANDGPINLLLNV